ncbi:coiled-coil domain-containing protein 151 isoform X2 [Cyprinodon tularosa]|uniref:coiled-coil domain-containing protein 151 isoform X2 n=1 Tax=Cyprinodon tularosa TaxID=77115 RepID=UPI0018E259BB|nr:coiled-coil domain-containing protein 151 isoform X2 [Cyprinodon tularosa]
MALLHHGGESSTSDNLTDFCVLEIEGSALYESSELQMKENQEQIVQLRQENDRLYSQLVDAGEKHVIEVALKQKDSEKEASLTLLGEDAFVEREYKVLFKKRRLNAIKHTTQTYQQQLDELKMEEEKIKKQLTCEKEEEAMKLRALENRLEKFQVKYHEAEKINLNYLKIKSHLQESVTYGKQIDSLEEENQKHREELDNMQIINNNAQLAKEATKAELQQMQREMSKKENERKKIIARLRHKGEELKSQAERAEKNVQKTITQPDDLDFDTQQVRPEITEEEENNIFPYEKAFRRISEATGCTDMQEFVKQFILQDEKYQHFEKLKQENEEVLLELKKEKELRIQQFEDMKYSEEAKLSSFLSGFNSDMKMLEKSEHQLQIQQQSRDAAAERLAGLKKTLSSIKVQLGNLAEKLQHIKLPEDKSIKVHPDSDQFVLELLTECELKIQILQEDPEGKDLKMKRDELFAKVENKIENPENQTQELGKETDF